MILQVCLHPCYGGAHKAVMRGTFIQLASHLKRERQIDIANLEKNFHSLSKTHKNKPTPASLAQLECSQNSPKYGPYL